MSLRREVNIQPAKSVAMPLAAPINTTLLQPRKFKRGRRVMIGVESATIAISNRSVESEK
jgi:hypothetical protein